MFHLTKWLFWGAWVVVATILIRAHHGTNMNDATYAGFAMLGVLGVWVIYALFFRPAARIMDEGFDALKWTKGMTPEQCRLDLIDMYGHEPTVEDIHNYYSMVQAERIKGYAKIAGVLGVAYVVNRQLDGKGML